MLLKLIYCRENEEGLYLWMQSLFIQFPSHPRDHFNWQKTSRLSRNMPQYKAVRPWYFAGIGNVGYQWKNESFSSVMLLKLLSGILEYSNIDTDSFLPLPEIYPFPAISPAFSSTCPRRSFTCKFSQQDPCFQVSVYQLPVCLHIHFPPAASLGAACTPLSGIFSLFLQDSCAWWLSFQEGVSYFFHEWELWKEAQCYGVIQSFLI